MLNNISVILRLFLAVILGGLIGLERELHKKGAGLRTHILVSLGSTLIMLTGIFVFDIFKDKVLIDPGRILAGVITGVGFLCAGTIIRSGEAIRGLTTAASLWIVAGIGLAIGCGFYFAALIATIFTLIVLFFLRQIETKLGKEG